RSAQSAPSAPRAGPPQTRGGSASSVCLSTAALAPPVPLRQRPQPQRVQPDEARRIAVVVAALPFLEGDEVLVVERKRALAANDEGIALVELHPHRPAHMLLAPVDQGLQHLALRREPEAVIDELRVARHDLVLEMHGAAVEGDALDTAVGGEQDRAARRFVDAARLHADEAVLDQIEPANAI